MNKKIKIVLIVFFLCLVCYQSYFFLCFKANTSIVITGQNEKEYGKTFLYLNNKKVDNVYLNKPFAYVDNHNLSFGKNKLIIKDSDSKIIYETYISFYGLFTWNLIEFNKGSFVKHKYYLQQAYD